MIEWLANYATTVLGVPSDVVAVLLGIGVSIGILLTFLFRRMVGKFISKYDRKEREWVIGEISFLATDSRSGFIDTRSGRKNVRFEPHSLKDETNVVLGQRVRFLADWSKIQPKARAVRPLPKIATKS